jgi:hypothetical protein
MPGNLVNFSNSCILISIFSVDEVMLY